MNRRPLSSRERLRLFALHRGICHICDGTINSVREAYDIEHVVPLAMDGADDDGNRKPAHRKCHGPKTKHDAGNLAEAKRREVRHTGALSPPPHPLQSRGFPTTPKREPKQMPPRRSLYTEG